MPFPQKAILTLVGLAIALGIGIPIYNPALFSPAGWVTFAGAVFTLIGLLAREFLAIRQMRKQHTVTVLLQSRLSTAFNDKLARMVKTYPVNPTITKVQPGDWTDTNKLDAIESLKYLLNYYEFISIGIRTGDLDEDFLYKSLEGIVSNLWYLGEAYIDFAQSKHDTVFENLAWLKVRWEERKAKEVAKDKGKKRLPKMPPFPSA